MKYIFNYCIIVVVFFSSFLGGGAIVKMFIKCQSYINNLH